MGYQFYRFGLIKLPKTLEKLIPKIYKMAIKVKEPNFTENVPLNPADKICATIIATISVSSDMTKIVIRGVEHK